MNVVDMIVDRCHVGASNMTVIRTVIGKLRNGLRTWKALPRRHREKVLRQIVRRHEANRSVYRFVVLGGRYGRYN